MCNITLTQNHNTSLSPFPLIHNQSFAMFAAAVKRRKMIVQNSAQAMLLNWLSIKSASGTSTPDASLKKLSKNLTINQSSTAISLIESTRKHIERRSHKEGKDRLESEKETFWMSFQKGSQTQRRKGKQLQSGVPIPPVFREPSLYIPSLPKKYSSFRSVCILHPYKHDCSIYCESKRLSPLKETSFFYILNRHGNPVKLWGQTLHLESNCITYNLKWRILGFTLSTPFLKIDEYPMIPEGGRKTYELIPGVRREPEPKSHPVAYHA